MTNENDSLHFSKSTDSSGHGLANIITPKHLTTSNSLEEIFAFARKENASDVHLLPQYPIIFRKFGQLINMTNEVLTDSQIRHLIIHCLPAKIIETFDAQGDAEYVHAITGYGRFRITLMKERLGWELAARLITKEIPRFSASGMPTPCASLIKWTQGIVLITGPAGCGKTTTMATLIEMINQRRYDHIITLEQPIEILYESELCQISQREIFTHTRNQESALRSALREDPDIIVVGELRDLLSIKLAIMAAETGHLVFATMNTVTAVQTIARLTESFPSEEQPVIRNLFSESLRGIISQQLIPKKDGTGMIPAFEILFNTPSIANHIRKATIGQIENVIVTSKNTGMILMSHSLQNLVLNGLISKEQASERTEQLETMI